MNFYAEFRIKIAFFSVETVIFDQIIFLDSNTEFNLYIIKCPNYDENSKLFLLVATDNV